MPLLWPCQGESVFVRPLLYLPKLRWVNRPWPECSEEYTWWRFKKYIGRNCRLHRWRGRKTCLQAFLDEVGIPQVFSLWVVQRHPSAHCCRIHQETCWRLWCCDWSHFGFRSCSLGYYIRRSDAVSLGWRFWSLWKPWQFHQYATQIHRMRWSNTYFLRWIDENLLFSHPYVFCKGLLRYCRVHLSCNL